MKNNIYRTIFTLFVIAGTSTLASAQQVKEPSILLTFTPVEYLLGFFILILLITIYVLTKSLSKLSKVLVPAQIKETTEREASIENSVKKVPLLTWVDQKILTRAVPIEKEKDILLDHDYDGIKELDNNLPPWWKFAFYATIIFAVVYLFNYHFSGGKNQQQEYGDEMAAAETAKAERMKNAAENVTAENVVAFSDASNIGEGKSTFVKLCSACHLSDGGGQVGPNLTDDYWLHGGGIKNVFTTISEGVPQKGMISWKNQLSPKQIQQVASFVLSLKGTKPTAPKEPQGDKWTEQPETKTTGDTTVTALRSI